MTYRPLPPDPNLWHWVKHPDRPPPDTQRSTDVGLAINPAAEARRWLQDLGELPALRDEREALVWLLIEQCEALEKVAAWAAEYRRVSESGSNVTASVWYQLTTALDALAEKAI